MRKNNSESVTNVVHRFLREYGLESPLNQYRLLAQWEKVMGPEVARQTRKLYIRNQSLYVELTSPALRMDLMMRRTELVRRLNGAVGAQVITELVIR